MANTYTQIYVQTVFAVEGRQSLISEAHKVEIYKYMTGVIQNQRQKVMAINGMPDHVHILVGLSPDIALSDLVKAVKVASSSLINDKRWVRGHFSWQRGFGAFSYSRSQVPVVARYIENQAKHHEKRSFRNEYIALLEKFAIDYDTRDLFTFIEDA